MWSRTSFAWNAEHYPKDARPYLLPRPTWEVFVYTRLSFACLTYVDLRYSVGKFWLLNCTFGGELTSVMWVSRRKLSDWQSTEMCCNIFLLSFLIYKYRLFIDCCMYLEAIKWVCICVSACTCACARRSPDCGAVYYAVR